MKNKLLGILFRITLGVVLVVWFVYPETGVATTVFCCAVTIAIECQSFLIRRTYEEEKLSRYTGSLTNDPKERSAFLERLKKAQQERK